jgi:hypothetical protein
LIFDAGVGRTFLVASVRVTTLLACLGSLYAVVLPKALKVQDLKDGLAVAKGTSPEGSNCLSRLSSPAAVLSTIPPFVTHIFTHSYVATITLILPRSARSSATALQRFVSRPAPDTVLHIQTVKPWGTWQNNVVSLLSLREAKHRWTRLENFTTIHGRRSIIGTGQKFYVGDAEKGQTRSRMPGVWTSLARLIKRNSEMESMSTS